MLTCGLWVYDLSALIKGLVYDSADLLHNTLIRQGDKNSQQIIFKLQGRGIIDYSPKYSRYFDKSDVVRWRAERSGSQSLVDLIQFLKLVLARCWM